MDKLSLMGWLLVLVAAVTIDAAPQFQHIYLGYVSPYDFLQGFGTNNAYQPYRPKRSAMASMNYGHHQPTNQHNKAMPYGHSFGYNPMMYPYKMFSFPAMPKFPEMHFPAMPKFNFPSYAFRYPIMHSGSFYNSGYQPYQAASSHPAPSSYYPFGDHFMKMMGFHGNPASSNYNNNNHGNAYNNNNNHHAATYNNNNNNHGYSSNMNYNSHPKGKNYEMSYSSSYNMNMDYANGKGHMVTKDSSYMNDNGKVYQHNGPEQHYTSYGNGKFMSDNSYNKH